MIIDIIDGLWHAGADTAFIGWHLNDAAVPYLREIEPEAAAAQAGEAGGTGREERIEMYPDMADNRRAYSARA